MPFSNMVLETMFEPSAAILLHFGNHFASILEATGSKKKYPKMHSHLQQAQTLNLHIVKHFSLSL